jgi:hypothetical protein
MTKETFMLLKTAYQKGTLTKKDFEAALFKAMTAGLLKGGVGKALQGLSKAVPGASEKVLTSFVKGPLTKNMGKDIAKKLYGMDAKFIDIILRDKGDDIAANVIEKVSGKYIEAAVLQTLQGAKGTETEKQLTKQLEQNLRKSKALQDEMRKLMEAEVIKLAEKAQPAK